MGVRGQAVRAGLVAATLGCLASAASATGAVRKAAVDYRATPTAAETEFFSEGGLSISGACAAGPQLTITLRSEVENAMLSTSEIHLGGNSHNSATNFDPGDTLGLLDDGQSDQGQIVYSTPAGTHVTIDWAAVENQSVAPGQCLLFGSAQVATPRRSAGKRRMRIDYRANLGAAARTILDAGGLRLRASCRGTEGAAKLRVVATSTANHAMLHAGALGQGTGPFYAGDDNLRAKRRGKRAERLNFLAKLDATDFGLGRLVYVTPKGKVVAARWLAEENNAYNSSRDCAFVGSARVLAKGKAGNAYFARRRARPVASSRARGLIPIFVPTTRFFELGGVELGGACVRTEEPGNLVVRYEVDLARQHATPYFTAGDASASGGGGSGGGSGGVADVMDDVVGAFLIRLSNGNTVAVDFLAEERNAFGNRKRCLFAGTGELTSAP